MSVRNVIVWPDDCLEEESLCVEEECVDDLIEDLIDTMEAYLGVGLAAPQIGINKRVIVIDKNIDKSLESHLVMINPVLKDGIGETVSQEGCLSFPGHTFYIPRCTNTIVSYIDENLNKQEKTFDGFLSIAIQHEVDHLDGRLLVDTVNREKRRNVKKSLKSFKKRYNEKVKNRKPSTG